ncbi:MAG: DNA cytosine methyltransferase [Marinobacterium sp.]|nr:DNA cytosine methyltransferase [Marinobacterium sp.]
MTSYPQDAELLGQLLSIYDARYLSRHLDQIANGQWTPARLKKLATGGNVQGLTGPEYMSLHELLPRPPQHHGNYDFRFVDLFAGIGGIRKGFEAIGGECVFTSEWNKFAVRTYKANHYCDPQRHSFNEDIRSVTLSDQPDISEEEAYAHIRAQIPAHDVLLAGFPCQPFSIAGVSKKNSLGRAHGFECSTQGTLFFDVARIIQACRPAAFVLENVKNLKSHDKGNTFRVIVETLDELGYWVADENDMNPRDPKVIDGRHFLPQHRERIVLVGFRKDLDIHHGFSLRDIKSQYPTRRPALGELLEPAVDDKYILTPKLWEYLYNYAAKHKAKGNGFGYGLVNEDSVTRTLSARYYKDGSEILVDRGWNFSVGFHDLINQANRPRRLTPRECARLMGFEQPGGSTFRIPVSDTQAYKQFGNSVVVPVFGAVAQLMKPFIERARVAERAAHNTD